MKKILILTAIVFICGCNTSTEPDDEQPAAEIVENFTLPICANGSGEWELYDHWGKKNGGQYHVIYIDIFATWCGPCQEAAPGTEHFVRDYGDQDLIVIGAGSDLNMPYSCEGWANAFNLSYPILNDDASDEGPRELFEGNYPVTVVIGHDMQMVYSASGRHNEQAIREAIESALSKMQSESAN